MMDRELEYLLSLEKSHRDSLAKQLIFDRAMEILYRAEGLSDEEIATTLLNALQALDKEDE